MEFTTQPFPEGEEGAPERASEEVVIQPEPSLIAPRWGYNMDKRPNSRPLPDPSLRA